MSVWDDFINSEFAKKAVASKTVEAKEGAAPKSAPGPLESVSWQSGNGHVPDATKFHDIKEVQKAIHDVATKQPKGKVAGLLAKLVVTAEAWESDERATELAPFVAELDSIIDSTMQQYK